MSSRRSSTEPNLDCFFRAAGAAPHPHVVAEGAQGLRDAGHRAGRLPPLLAALLHLVPHSHHLRHVILPLPRLVLFLLNSEIVQEFGGLQVA